MLRRPQPLPGRPPARQLKRLLWKRLLRQPARSSKSLKSSPWLRGPQQKGGAVAAEGGAVAVEGGAVAVEGGAIAVEGGTFLAAEGAVEGAVVAGEVAGEAAAIGATSAVAGVLGTVSIVGGVAIIGATVVLGILCAFHKLGACKKRVCADINGRFHSQQRHCKKESTFVLSPSRCLCWSRECLPANIQDFARWMLRQEQSVA